MPDPTPIQRPPEAVAAQLNVPQRMLLFCVASNTDWRKVGITSAIVQLAIIKKLVDRDETTTHLTKHGHAVLAALLSGHLPLKDAGRSWRGKLA